MIHIIAWLIGSALAFLALRELALRDFGTITVGWAILLLLYSLLTPCALSTVFILWLIGDGPSIGFLGKVVWTRR